MAEVTITVYGTPAPQGSKRAFAGKDGRVHVIESSHDRVKSWRQAVIEAAGQAMADAAGGFPLTGPLHAEMVFTLRRPKSHYRTGKNAHLLRDSAPPYPSGTPDVGKLARATEDALTAVGCWADDAQVVIYAPLAKQWATPHRLPGADIRIREMRLWPSSPPSTPPAAPTGARTAAAG